MEMYGYADCKNIIWIYGDDFDGEGFKWHWRGERLGLPVDTWEKY